MAGARGRRRRVDGTGRRAAETATAKQGRASRASDVGLELLSQVDAGVTHEAAGIILFKHIFRIAPQALPLFSFGRVEGAEVNDALFAQEALKAHATKVVATVATCARIKISGAHAGHAIDAV